MTLSDEQLDLLHRHEEVLEARRLYLRKLAEGFKTQDQKIVDEAHNVLWPAYLTIFKARLAWVEANPPEPKAKPVTMHTGFAKRA